VYTLLADRVLTSGHAVRRVLLRAGVRPEKIVSLPAGVDLTRFLPGISAERIREGLNLDGPVVGSVAMFRGSKGHVDLLQAFTLVRARVPGVKLLFVGDGGRRAMVEALARERDLKDAVIFTGFRRDVPELLSAMQVFVLASTRTEGVPQSLLQAMAMMVPVIATNTGGVSEVVENGMTGLLVRPNDPAALADAIVRVLTDPEGARERAGRARDLVVRHYSRERALDGLEAVYRSLFRAGGGPLNPGVFKADQSCS
jgi:glycosyltransferase involved in cell wall biosynthesis